MDGNCLGNVNICEIMKSLTLFVAEIGIKLLCMCGDAIILTINSRYESSCSIVVFFIICFYFFIGFVAIELKIKSMLA